MRALLLPLLQLLAAAAPLQQPPPQPPSQPPAQQPLQPTRDVAVTYVVEGEATGLVPGGIPGPVTLSWDAAGQRLRAEAAGRSQVALLDLRTHAGRAIDTGLRLSLPLPVRASDLQPLTLQGTRLTPTGKDRVAGLPCTVFSTEAGGRTGSVCLTADGVPLRGAGEVDGRPGRFRATAVRFGALPDALFTVPSGFIALGGPSGGGSNGGSGGGAGGLPGNLGDLRNLGAALLGRGR